MDQNALATILTKFHQAVERQGIAVSEMILFGSQAKGTAHYGSDIDVVIVSESFAGLSLVERIRLLAKAIYEVFEPIEAWAFTPEEFAEGKSPIIDFAREGQHVC